MGNIKINIQELALLMGWKPSQASSYFHSFCIAKDIIYKKGLEVSIVDLGEHMKTDLVAKAEHLRSNYLKYSDQRAKILNDKKGISTSKLKAPLTALRKVLKQEDISLILKSWETKNKHLNNQLNFL